MIISKANRKTQKRNNGRWDFDIIKSAPLPLENLQITPFGVISLEDPWLRESLDSSLIIIGSGIGVKMTGSSVSELVVPYTSSTSVMSLVCRVLLWSDLSLYEQEGDWGIEDAKLSSCLCVCVCVCVCPVCIEVLGNGKTLINVWNSLYLRCLSRK